MYEMNIVLRKTLTFFLKMLLRPKLFLIINLQNNIKLHLFSYRKHPAQLYMYFFDKTMYQIPNGYNVITLRFFFLKHKHIRSPT